MPSTLSSRKISYEELAQYTAHKSSNEAVSGVNLPTFSRTQRSAARAQHLALAGNTQQKPHVVQRPVPQRAPQVAPKAVPERQTRRAPLVVRANRALRTVLVALCGVAIVGYGLDVAASNDVGRLQEQARRLNEQNSELSAQLLRAISFQGIQDNVVGRFGLRVPEQVTIVQEVPPPKVPHFQASRHHLPIMAGY